MHRPSWVSSSLYPFDSEYFDSDDGSLHYVDRGTGHPVLMVHGTPTWSFLYRDLVSHFSAKYRVIALDHLGFGLSSKPADVGYRPEDHARRLTDFIAHLGLEDFTLVVHDFGGPIGLSYAIEHPENVTRLVLFNTWLWSLQGDRSIGLMHLAMRGLVGRVFYRRFNGSPRILLRAAWGDHTTLTDEVHRHYTNPFPTAEDRTAPWILARELIGSTDWYESLWERRSRITGKPSLVLWGLEDPAFGESYLERWAETLTDASVHRFPDVGHFVPDEAASRVTPRVSDFLEDS